MIFSSHKKILPQNKFTAGDAVVLSIVLVAAIISALILFFQPKGDTVVITSQSGSVSYSLAVDRVVTVKSYGYTLTVTIENNTAAVTDSDCPDKICAHTPAISNHGSCIICVPAEVSVEISAAQEDGDADYIIK